MVEVLERVLHWTKSCLPDDQREAPNYKHHQQEHYQFNRCIMNDHKYGIQLLNVAYSVDEFTEHEQSRAGLENEGRPQISTHEVEVVVGLQLLFRQISSVLNIQFVFVIVLYHKTKQLQHRDHQIAVIIFYELVGAHVRTFLVIRDVHYHAVDCVDYKDEFQEVGDDNGSLRARME